MKLFSFIVVSSFLFLLSFSFARGKLSQRRKKGEPKKPVLKKKPPKLNTDNLPNITEILVELGLTHRESDLRTKGVTDTRHLLRLEKMDFHMMKYDWDGDAEADVDLLKSKAEELLPLAIVSDKVEVVKDDRHKYKLGRVYIPGFVKSFEYISASFGVPPPIGPLPIVIANPIHGCEPQTSAEGKMLVVARGECTFLQKSLAAHSSKAALLVITNSEDRLESVTNGYGIDKSIKNVDIVPLLQFSVISTSNTSLAPIQHAFNISKDPLLGHAVPLDCSHKGQCVPSNEIEKSYQFEATWGRIQILGKEMTSLSFDFLTSNFGGILPVGNIPVSASSVIGDACSPIHSTLSLVGSAVLVTRGNCPFDVKAMNVQNAGGILMIIEDPLDRALQRIGASHPLDGHVGIPSIAIPLPCSEYIRQSFATDGKTSIRLQGSPTSIGSEKWVEVSYTQWAEAKTDKLAQLEGMMKKYETDSSDIVAWLKRRITEIEESFDWEL